MLTQRSTRAIARTVLSDDVRLREQPLEKVLEAYQLLESQFPSMGSCYQHWKSEKIFKQVLDNMKDCASRKHGKKTRKSLVNDDYMRKLRNMLTTTLLTPLI